MMMTAKARYGEVVDLEQYFPDGRLTEPMDGKRYEWRKMMELVKELGRPLTEEEAEKFRVNLSSNAINAIKNPQTPVNTRV